MSMTRHQTLALLQRYESRNVTFISPNGSWPIVWTRARGVKVWDSQGRRYLDLTAAFGVAAAGHANGRVVRAGRRQMGELLHAMGDVHPHALKARLARELSRITFERWTRGRPPGRRLAARTIFCNSGFEAVEAALKTALLATSRPGVIAFRGAYHGLGYGTLNATHRPHFRERFRPQLGGFGEFVPFPTTRSQLPGLERSIRSIFRRKRVGAILVEPIQARGGIVCPPAAFLPKLRQLCREHGALLILDEIYTGFGRTGAWFATEHSGTIPDLVCLGKALTGGFPMSACVGESHLMNAAWPASTGEAIHTSTYLGHPVGCAMALAQIRELRDRKLVPRSAALGKELLKALGCLPAFRTLHTTARGLGLMAGLELCGTDGAPATEVALEAMQRLLERGFLFLPEGEHANVIAFTPPLIIPRRQLLGAVQALKTVLVEIDRER